MDRERRVFPVRRIKRRHPEVSLSALFRLLPKRYQTLRASGLTQKLKHRLGLHVGLGQHGVPRLGQD
jgi:hypothetical protein